MGMGSDTPPSRDKLAPTRGAGLSGDSFLVQTSIVGASLPRELFSSCSFTIFSAFENHIERGFIPPKVMPISYCLTLLRFGACPAFRINSLAGIS